MPRRQPKQTAKGNWNSTDSSAKRRQSRSDWKEKQLLLSTSSESRRNDSKGRQDWRLRGPRHSEFRPKERKNWSCTGLKERKRWRRRGLLRSKLDWKWKSVWKQSALREN